MFTPDRTDAPLQRVRPDEQYLLIELPDKRQLLYRVDPSQRRCATRVPPLAALSPTHRYWSAGRSTCSSFERWLRICVTCPLGRTGRYAQQQGADSGPPSLPAAAGLQVCAMDTAGETRVTERFKRNFGPYDFTQAED